ncbi:MAG: hypothetical protein AAFN79_14070 [Pseudomonadota bacterium]
MRSAILAVVAALSLSAPNAAVAASAGETTVRAQIEKAGFNNPRKIGVMAGARHYCELQIEQFLEPYWMRISFTQQNPDHEWSRMIDEAKKTIVVLRKASTPCDDDFKTYLERLAY